MRRAVKIGIYGGLLLLAAILVSFLPHYDRYFGVAKYESGAVGNLETLNKLESEYAESHREMGYTCEFNALPPTGSAFDPSVGSWSGERSGYKFALIGCKTDGKAVVVHYQIVATPLRPYRTGVRAFCTDETTKLFYDLNGSGSECLAYKHELR